ncbi:MAG: hypothetical protein QM770_19130 [Tepidisphaeraceae bacterium]
MYFSARQLQQILRETGAANLPFGARLTPAAQDFLRANKLEIRYGDPATPKPAQLVAPSAPSTSAVLWWSGTASGVAKAAISMVSREANLLPLTVLEDGTKALSAVRALAAEVKTGRATGGVLIADHAGAAVVFANKVPCLRAIVATSLASLDAAVRDVAANVLIVEPASHTMMSLKNVIARFVRASRQVNAELERDLSVLGGGAA